MYGHKTKRKNTSFIKLHTFRFIKNQKKKEKVLQNRREILRG